jgi:hypothetical protein
MEPLVEYGAGGSGRRSMLANRNANGQLRKLSTRLGDRELGTGYMPVTVENGCDTS